MDIKVNIKQEPKKDKPRGIKRAIFALAIFFAIICQCSIETSYKGNHSHQIVELQIISGGFSALFFLVFFALLFGNLEDNE